MTARFALAKWLEATGWTQAKLAKAARIDHSTLSRILRGDREVGLTCGTRLAAAMKSAAEHGVTGGVAPVLLTELLPELQVLAA